MKRIMAKSNNQEAAKSFLIQKMVTHKVLDEQNKIVSYLNCSPRKISTPKMIMTNANWIPILGAPLISSKGSLIFRGGVQKADDQEGERALMGLYITNETFTGGRASFTVRFNDVELMSCAELVIRYDPLTQHTLNVGIPVNSYNLFGVREWRGGKWEQIAGVGQRDTLQPNKDYDISVVVDGSLLSLFVDGVETTRCNLPFPFSQSQAGLFFIGRHDIVVKSFEIQNQKPKAFVVMQFAAPYNDVYMEVIKSVCEELGVEVMRIDEAMGPGLIISDISQAILSSTIVIADISPLNANVFYEVGYAHGINKPTILIAEKGTKLPFDVSPFRTLFYENSIAGKNKLDNGLREYIKTVLNVRGATSKDTPG